MNFDNAFLKFMRDQGAQRAYRNVAEWLRTETILNALAKIEVELAVIDARRAAFTAGDTARATSQQQEEGMEKRGEPWNASEFKERLKTVVERARKRDAARKRRRPHARRRTRSGS